MRLVSDLDTTGCRSDWSRKFCGKQPSLCDFVPSEDATLRPMVFAVAH